MVLKYLHSILKAKFRYKMSNDEYNQNPGFVYKPSCEQSLGINIFDNSLSVSYFNVVKALIVTLQ